MTKDLDKMSNLVKSHQNMLGSHTGLIKPDGTDGGTGDSWVRRLGSQEKMCEFTEHWPP